MGQIQIYHVYQPLFTLYDLEIFGYEVLTRCDNFSDIEHLFQQAMENKTLYELDTTSIFKALSTSGLSHKIFINIYPSTMLHPQFFTFLQEVEQRTMVKDSIVFEINESEKIKDRRLFKNIVNRLKRRGYEIAVDDYGKGEATFDFITDIDPHYIKLDQSFSRNLTDSFPKQQQIRSLVEICHERNMTLILEGIENKSELLVAAQLGVHVGQGYYLGKPK